jgi:hypothetical protein
MSPMLREVGSFEEHLIPFPWLVAFSARRPGGVVASQAPDPAQWGHAGGVGDGRPGRWTTPLRLLRAKSVVAAEYEVNWSPSRRPAWVRLVVIGAPAPSMIVREA